MLTNRKQTNKPDVANREITWNWELCQPTFLFFWKVFSGIATGGVQKYCQKSAKRGKSGRKDQNWDGSFTLPLLTNTKNRAGYATGLHHARNLSTLERWKCRRSHVMSHVSGGINSKILLACPKKIWAKVCFFGFSKKKKNHFWWN